VENKNGRALAENSRFKIQDSKNKIDFSRSSPHQRETLVPDNGSIPHPTSSPALHINGISYQYYVPMGLNT
jgi:hypothetical protein